MEMIEYQRSTQITTCLTKMHILIKRNRNNILFLDYMILHRYLHTHYVEKRSIQKKKYDFNTLNFLSEEHYSVLIHTYCENLLQYQSLYDFKQFYQTLEKQEGSILLDFLKCLLLHLENKSEETISLFYKNREHLQKDQKTKQLIRFGSIVCLQQLSYSQVKAEKNIRHILRYTPKCNFKSQYFYFLLFTITCIYTYQEKYEKAFITLYNYCMKNQNLMHHSIPYLLFLSYECNIKFDPSCFIVKDALANACISYAHFKNSKKSSSSHILFMYDYILSLLETYPHHDCLLILLNNEKQRQYQRRKCQKAAQLFQNKVEEIKRKT